MVITHESIPDGSYTLRGFHGKPNVSDIDLVLTLVNKGDGVCELDAAKGDLTPEGNILIAIKAIELGFHTLEFRALKGSKVSRWAKYVNSDEYFDYYTVDLQKTMEQIKDANTIN